LFFGGAGGKPALMALDLSYEVTGEGPPLVVLHGLFGAARNWRMIARGLADGYRVWCLDLRNHGESPWDDDMSYEAMAGDVRAFMVRHGIEGAAVMGHSMGGKAAMTLALSHPELVGALIVVDIAPVSRPPDLRSYVRAMADIDLSAVSRRAEVGELLAPAVEDRSVRAFLLQNLVMTDGVLQWRLNLDVIGRLMEAIGGFPETLLERQYAGPTHFISGALSVYLGPEHRDLILSLFPATTMSVIAGAGHWLHAEKPDSFLRALRRFLGR
jgi:pimeloyl-ACP methyl ester carboxylesterase